MLDPTIGFLLATGFSLLFAAAFWQKARAISDFAAIFAAYRVLPEPVGRRMAWLIPMLELTIAVLLWWEPGRRAAAVGGACLLIAYAGGIAINLVRGRYDLDCGCSTRSNRRPIAAWMIWRNVFMSAALGAAALPWSSRPFSAADAATLLGGLTVAATLYMALDRLLGEVAPRTAALRRLG